VKDLLGFLAMLGMTGKRENDKFSKNQRNIRAGG